LQKLGLIKQRIDTFRVIDAHLCVIHSSAIILTAAGQIAERICKAYRERKRRDMGLAKGEWVEERGNGRQLGMVHLIRGGGMGLSEGWLIGGGVGKGVKDGSGGGDGSV
jgi:hypothetical protein